MNKNWFKNFDICLPVISVAVAMLVTPQFGFWGAGPFDLDRIRWLFLLLVLSIFGFNYLSGVDARMFCRSKSEYIVNRFVCTSTAWIFVDMCLAAARNELIGRVVVIVGVFIDVFMSLVISRFLSRTSFSSSLVAISADCCKDLALLNELEKERFEIYRIEAGRSDRIDGVIDNYRLVAVIVDGRRDEPFYDPVVERKLGRLAMSPNLFRRRFLQLVPLVDIRALSWWAISSPLTDVKLILVKRLFDIIIGVIGLVFSIPILFLVWFIYRFVDKGPLIYSQVRLGQWGRTFRIYKIRSMRNDSEVTGPRWASLNDDRTTRVGRFLRKSRLDEIPQFWNVLVGDMSFVGPRPERPEMAEVICRSVPEFSVRLAAKPGITGWAQVCYPYGSSIEDAIHKLEYDVYYIKYTGLRFEARILLRTIIAMFKGAR